MTKQICNILRCLWTVTISLVDIIFVVLILTILCWGIIQETTGKSALFIEIVVVIISIITLYLTIIRRFFLKAMLSYEIDVQESKSPIEGSPSSIFYRLRIENYGLTMATHCVGRLIGVWDCNGNQITKIDSLSLYWSRQDGKEITPFKPIDIQGRGDFDFLDIVQQIDNKLVIRVFIPSPMTLTIMPENSLSPGDQPDLILPGLYYLKVGIYAGETFISPMILKIGSPEESDSTTKELIFKKVRKIPNPR